MARLSKEQIKEIIKNRPQGTNPAGIVAELRNQGHTLEGYPEDEKKVEGEEEKSKRTTLDKVSGFFDSVFGGGKLGEALGGSIAAIGQAAKGNFEQASQIAQNQPSIGQQLGSAGKALTTLGSAAAPQARGASLAGRAGFGAAEGVIQGGALGASEAAQEGEGLEEIAKDTLGEGATGAVIGSLFPLAGPALKNTSRSIFNKVFKRTKGETEDLLERELRERGADPAEVLLRRRKAGTAKGLLRKTDKELKNVEDEIQTIIGGVDEEVRGGQVGGEAINRTIRDFDGNVDPDKIESVFENSRLPFKKILEDKPLSVKEANKLRRVIDNQFIGNSKWMNQGPEPLQVSVLKNTANTLREFVQNSHPALPRLFEDQQGLIVGKNLLQSTAASKKGFYRKLIEGSGLIGSAGFAAASGSFTPLGVTAGLIGTGQALTSSPVKSGTAIGMDVLGSAINRLPETFTREQLINALNQAQQETPTQIENQTRRADTRPRTGQGGEGFQLR